MASTTSKPWATGSCLCGKIRYEVASKPEEVTRFICHCVTCKKASGSCFMSNWWMSEKLFSIQTGHEHLGEFVVKETTSGKPVMRRFCRECGSPISLSSDMVKGQVGVTAGTLDIDPEMSLEESVALAWSPDAEVFVDDRVRCMKPMEGVKQVGGSK